MLLHFCIRAGTCGLDKAQSMAKTIKLLLYFTKTPARSSLTWGRWCSWGCCSCDGPPSWTSRLPAPAGTCESVDARPGSWVGSKTKPRSRSKSRSEKQKNEVTLRLEIWKVAATGAACDVRASGFQQQVRKIKEKNSTQQDVNPWHLQGRPVLQPLCYSHCKI